MSESMNETPQQPQMPAMLGLMDQTPPTPGEIRIDTDGVLWRWEPSHHTVAEEAQINASGADYWDKRLTSNSDDADAEVHEVANGIEDHMDGPATEGMAYHWQLKR
jgi:hypothetical protein